MESNCKRIGLVFPFNEVNAGVFQNAGLWAAKQKYGISTSVYTPRHFEALYFATDEIITISPLPYHTYGEVGKHEPNIISKKNISTWLTKGTLNYFHHKLLELAPTDIFHALPPIVRSDYKTRKFLIKSGILDLCEANFYSNNPKNSSAFLGDCLYFNLAEFKKIRKNLTEYFQYSFENLEKMILAKNIYFGVREFNNYELPLEETALNFLRNFNPSIPKIFLRTRNISNSVSFQNAPRSELRILIQELLNQDFVILHAGVPTLSLGIEHQNYLEFNHNLSLGGEMDLANKCDYIMTTAWAGLFTAFASFHKPLITFDQEWSLSNLKNPVSLLKARNMIGIKDINIGRIRNQDNKYIKSLANVIVSASRR